MKKMEAFNMIRIFNQKYDRMGHGKYPTNIMIVIATNNKKKY